MIRSFEHKGLAAFYETGSRAGIQPHHAPKLARQLSRLHAARGPEDMNLPGWRLHALEGKLADHFAVTVNGNWRLTFRFDGQDAVLVNCQDHH